MDRETVDRFAATLRARGRQPATVESYCRDAQRFLDYLIRNRVDPSQVESAVLLSYQDHLRDDCEERDNSIRRTVIGIRQFYRYLTEAKVLRSTPFDEVPIPTRDDSLPKALSQDDLDAVMQVALTGKPDFKGARDAAMISLLAHEGIKANELIQLVWSDFMSAGSDASPSTLRIAGPRARVIPLSKESADLLLAYRHLYGLIRHPVIVQSPLKRMFIAFKGRDAASPLPEMTRHGLKFVVYELGSRVGLPKLNTEQLRHFAVNWHLSLGRTPEEIMSLLGLRRLGNIAKHIARTPKSIARRRPIEGATRAAE